MKENNSPQSGAPVSIKNTNNLTLILEYGIIWDFQKLPEKSIALDGSVMGPKIDTNKKIYSFDHHGNCVRHASSATCVQVLDAVLLGLDPYGFNIYINDLDADTMLSYTLLKYPELAQLEKVQNIVRAVGLLDAHGPAYPLNEKIKQKIDFLLYNIFESAENLRTNRDYSKKNLKNILLKCTANFIQWVEEGFPIKINSLERGYKIYPKTGKDWIMVNSENYVFDLIYNDGYTKAVSWQLLADGSFSYTIGKKSEFVDFPVKEILEHLNSVESGWGGGSTIGGAPRNTDGSRSKIQPEKLVLIINDFLLKIKL